MSDVLAGVGVVLAAAAGCAAILLPVGRARALAMLAALVLFPALILADQWDSRQIADLRGETTRLLLGLLVTLVLVSALALAFSRWRSLAPLAIVAALPFRVPLEAGGDTANLLVPLYLVLGGAVLAAAFGELRSRGGDGQTLAPVAVWLSRALALVVALYAIQTLYSPDFSKSLQNVCFFFIPFSLVYALLREVRWDGRLLVATLCIVAFEASAFVLVGTVEYATKSLFWNDHVIRSNEFHAYFRVNSVFWDPNIYGRYLALTITLAMATLLWAREQRAMAALTALIAIGWVGLVPTFSQSSFAALLAGLAALAAIRWSRRWTLRVAVLFAIAVVAIFFVGGLPKFTSNYLNVVTGGRANLVTGGIELFAKRPVWGFGSGSFPRAYREQVATAKVPVEISHTQPVTVAAEQGLIGLAAYGALLIAAIWAMARGLGPLRSGRTDGAGANAVRGPPFAPQLVARAAVLAAFAALLVHTMSYAGFFEDPISWVLMAMGATLASGPVRDAT